MEEPVWSLSRKSLEVADQVYYEELEPISLEGYGEGILTEPGEAPVMQDHSAREVYSDCLFDLVRLLEEVRFEIAFATMLTSDFRARNPVDEEPVKPRGVDGSVIDMTLSIELLAVLSAMAGPPPSPSVLASDLHRKMLGGRHLSRWVAVQMLDSAMIRAMASLDRVASMLHVRAGLPVERARDGAFRLPPFGRDTLRSMNFAYKEHPAWEDLRAVPRHDMYKIARSYRNGNVHHRRYPSELHGERTASYWDAGAAHEDGPQPERRYEGLTALESIGLAFGTWNRVLLPAIHAGARLVAT